MSQKVIAGTRGRLAVLELLRAYSEGAGESRTPLAPASWRCDDMIHCVGINLEYTRIWFISSLHNVTGRRSPSLVLPGAPVPRGNPVARDKSSQSTNDRDQQSIDTT